jgi:hypothetical protein
MAVATGVYVLRDAIVSVDGVEYNNQCTVARLVPSQNIQTLPTLVPDGVLQDVDTPTWVFEVTCVQKNNTGGLVKALRAMTIGEVVEVILAPTDLVGEDQATFDIVALKPPFGGTQGQFPTLELSFPVQGQPVFAAIA